MTTGFTAMLEEREMSFFEFATHCLKAFMMVYRDHGNFGEPLPPLRQLYKSELEYAQERIVRAMAELVNAQELTPAKARKILLDSYKSSLKIWETGKAKHDVVVQRFKKMEEKVNRMPSNGELLKGLKRFMLEQLGYETESKYDYYAQPPAEPKEADVQLYIDREVEWAEKHLKDTKEQFVNLNSFVNEAEIVVALLKQFDEEGQ